MIPNNYPYYIQNQNYIPPQQQAQNPFITVRSEAEARNYPVAFGNSVTFKDETAPYVYSKTMGFSQLDKPVFEKYRLIKEESDGEQSERECKCNGLKEQLANLEEQITSLWEEIELLRERRKRNEHTSNGKSNQTKSDGGVIPEI